jgi:hypothetical protein
LAKIEQSGKVLKTARSSNQSSELKLTVEPGSEGQSLATEWQAAFEKRQAKE